MMKPLLPQHLMERPGEQCTFLDNTVLDESVSNPEACPFFDSVRILIY